LRAIFGGKKSLDNGPSQINFDEALNFKSRSKVDQIQTLSMMLKIRIVENKLAQMRKNGLIGGPVHLGAGQEAIAVGISKYLRKSDRVFSGHRSHAHLLALGADPRKLFAEVLGKRSGLTKGMGGSMHLWDGPNGFYGSIPIVAGTVPLAVGAALASRLQGKSDISVAYFGDGAMEEGVVHESLNLARQLRVPILFVCENNLFSSHMHISQRQPLTSVARFAIANDIQSEVIDGNNILSVEESAEKLVKIARTDNLPVFIEAFTYRHYGHVDWREDIDVGVNRSPEDLKLWKSRDPILRLELALLSNSLLDKTELEQIKLQIGKQIDADWNLAMQDPQTETSALLSNVYKN
jgi:TPP-dependent pyruvate/acetoin dehydrogenase alpha subunit